LIVLPLVELGQNYSPESLAFMVRLYYELGKIGSIGVRTNTSFLHIKTSVLRGINLTSNILFINVKVFLDHFISIILLLPD
jgi:hypothetical protein